MRASTQDRIDRIEPKLSIIICTVRPERCATLVRTLIPYASMDEIIVIVDGPVAGGTGDLNNIAIERNIRIVNVRENQGLSDCRNLGITLATNRCVIFLDDDVQLISDIVAGYRRRFLEGYDVIGGPLRLPASYPRLPWWLPSGLAYLLGIHTTESKIWGGNFGFVRAEDRARQVWFRAELGRKGGGLQSGDDTTFVNELVASANARPCFAMELAVEHHIELTRYRPAYLVRRAFWQGRSEVRRRSFRAALRKEAARATALGRSGTVRMVRAAVGAAIFGSFLGGMLYEFAIGTGRRHRHAP